MEGFLAATRMRAVDATSWQIMPHHGVGNARVDHAHAAPCYCGEQEQELGHSHGHSRGHAHAQSHGSGAMRALVDAFSDAVNAEVQLPQEVPPAARLPTPAGPQPLGSIMQLAKETGLPRKVCKAALVEHAKDFEVARRSLVPSPPGAPAEDRDSNSSADAVPAIFEPSHKFDGGRPGCGWLYKRGPLGLGYYREGQQVACASQG